MRSELRDSVWLNLSRLASALWKASWFCSIRSSIRRSVSRAPCVTSCAAPAAAEQRRILLRADQRRRRRIAALQRYRGDAGETLEFQADLGVLAHRHRLLDRNDGDHLLRPLGVELEIGDFADADAVEQHRGAGAQAGNRSVEHHAVVGALAGAADVLEPVDESEHAEHDAQREQPDHHIISSGFHHATPAKRSTLRDGPPATACRGNRPAARDG